MKFVSLTLVLVCACLAQDPLGPSLGRGGSHPSTSEGDSKLAQTQREALIKADHKKNVEDAEALLKIAEDLKADLEKQDANVVSVKNIKQTEDIQKLAKNIHGRLNRY